MGEDGDAVDDTVEYDREGGRYRAWYDPRCDSASAVIVEAVAAIEETDATTLEPLYGAVDADALDRLMASAADVSDPGVRMEFTVHGYAITVQSTGEIVLRPSSSDGDE